MASLSVIGLNKDIQFLVLYPPKCSHDLPPNPYIILRIMIHVHCIELIVVFFKC